MTTVFVGGSRKIKRLTADVQRRLDRIIEKGLPVVIGDANGADKSAQAYLHRHGYGSIEVGRWPWRPGSASCSGMGRVAEPC